MAHEFSPDLSFDQPIPAKIPQVRIVQIAPSDFVVQVRTPSGRWERRGETRHSLATAQQDVHALRNPFTPTVVAVYE